MQNKILGLKAYPCRRVFYCMMLLEQKLFFHFVQGFVLFLCNLIMFLHYFLDKYYVLGQT